MQRTAGKQIASRRRRMQRVGALCVLAWVAHAPVTTAAAPFPGCAWPIVSTPTSANVLYPDSNSTYWTTPYRARPGMRIYLEGAYPNARYFSIQAYDNVGQPYSVGGVSSSLTDYEIVPSTRFNPWSPAAPRYRVTLRSLRSTSATARAATLRNTLPLAPDRTPSGGLPGDFGFLMVRVYLPPDLDFSAVSLPSITIKHRGRKPVTLPRCGSGEGTSKLNASAVGRKTLDLASGRTLPPPAAPCPPGEAGCPPNLQFFVPPSGNDIPFPNTTSGYAAVFFTPQAGKVVVIRAKVPTSPFDFAGGERPVPWPRSGTASWQVRYWSLCNYVYEPPYPVVVTPGTDGSVLYGCAADLQVPTADQGRVTAVVSFPADRPANATAANGITWLPMSATDPTAIEQVSLRNMLVSNDFANSPKSAAGHTVADAQEAMGEYYPQAAMCDVATFEAGGADACLGG